MTLDRMIELFGNDDEFLKDSHISPSRRLHNRPDLNAFLLLDRLCPGTIDMVSWSEHDEFGMSVSLEDMESATEEDILDLIRCGVRYDSDNDSLCMFS